MEHSLNLTSFALLAAVFGIVALGVPLLLSAPKQRLTRAPLVLYLVASCTANGLPLLIALFPPLELYGLGILLPLYMLLPASLWWYVLAITSPTPWTFGARQYWHLLPAGLATGVSACLFALPADDLNSLFIDPSAPSSEWAQTVVICAFALMVLWVFLSAAYVVHILIRLKRHRVFLKDQFANNEGRDLHWINGALLVLSVTWILSLFYSVPLLTNQALPLSEAWIAAAHMVLLWTFSLFGIRQKPAYEGRYLEASDIPIEFAPPPREKYLKSGLDEEALNRIAEKLEATMREQQLYLDHTLSLSKLAEEVKVSKNYLSQTLNEQLKKTFFDYVNGWRIQYALPEVIAAQKSILKLAMDAGFNARSSFYSAFKKEVGCSPSEYRKRQAGKL